MKYKNFYLMSLLAVILASVYPIYMGFVTLSSYLQNGSIDVTEYPKYIIPYTPICIALIMSIALMPLIFKLFEGYTLPVVSFLGTVIFFASEFGFEQIKVIEGYVEMPLESWQLSLCITTPEVLRSIGEPIYAANNPAFKIHFYLIAIVIILAVLNVINGFSKMLREQDFCKKRPLIAQAVSVVLFIGLCILACFTAFYRNGTINISTLSAILMSVFFIVFGITAGIYCGSIFYGKSNLLSKIIPAMTASVTTLIMYIGELVLMDGVLFKYGNGFFFEPIEGIPFSAADIVIILVSGVIAYIVMRLLNHSNS
ncbi:hypothetical protein [Desulfosporosinus nitroreducens]|uniref:ABC transporter permease n=1 Tax=Desulfosporosinus nitroreducens TaxID=2018668 RepID=A0ABT8QR68_9FIRM|nr:hypothetical protein [Desulfosporosinus nitroreducens]MCO1603048.1 hypothetical protein [Desulfosporosinus nitroreducens]MDO0823836.1 hypothetical protein [Desulfosporosinus nitroreducens]